VRDAKMTTKMSTTTTMTWHEAPGQNQTPHHQLQARRDHTCRIPLPDHTKCRSHHDVLPPWAHGLRACPRGVHCGG
jgi:hypothetical protein